MGPGTNPPDSGLIHTFAGSLGPVSYIWRAPVITLMWRSDGSVNKNGMSNGLIKFIEPETK